MLVRKFLVHINSLFAPISESHPATARYFELAII